MAPKQIKILFIVNPISGIGKQKQVEKLVEDSLDKQRFSATILYTEYAGHATKLAQDAAGIYDVVTAVGGDGSINEIAKALVNTPTALAIIPCGSGNGLARALNIPMKPAHAVEHLNKAEFKAIDSFYVNDRFFISLAGCGYDSLVARLYDFYPGRGFKTYFKAVLSSYLKYKPLEYTIKTDDSTIRRKALLVTACNSSQFGYGFRIAPEAKMDDGLLDLVIMKKPEWWRVPFVLLSVALGRAHKSCCFEIMRTSHVEISGNESRYVNLDGETVRMDSNLRFDTASQISVFC